MDKITVNQANYRETRDTGRGLRDQELEKTGFYSIRYG